MAHAASIEEYIEGFSGKVKERLQELRLLIRTQLPQAEECISYGIPAYVLNKKRIIYFAGYDEYVSIYPVHADDTAYQTLAAPYAHGRATLRFAHAAPFPRELIAQVIQLRLKEQRI